MIFNTSYILLIFKNYLSLRLFYPPLTKSLYKVHTRFTSLPYTETEPKKCIGVI